MSAQSPGSPITVTAELKAAQALELRVRRWSYPMIAAELGFSGESGARMAVMRELERVRAVSAERALELREIELAALERTERRLAAIIDNPATPEARVADCARTQVAVMARRARLAGLDEALRVDVTARLDDTPDALNALLAPLAEPTE